MRRAMTCVYCEPKSRIRIFECADGATVFTALRMSLGHAMLTCRVIGRPLDWAEGPLPGYAALKLTLYFLRAVLFHRISTAARDQTCRDEQDRRAFHLLILESDQLIARRLKPPPRENVPGGSVKTASHYVVMLSEA